LIPVDKIHHRSTLVTGGFLALLFMGKERVLIRHMLRVKPVTFMRTVPRSIARLSISNKSLGELNSGSEQNLHWFYFNRLFLGAGILGKFAPTSLFAPSQKSIRELLQNRLKLDIEDVNLRPAEGGAFVNIRGDLDAVRSTAKAGFHPRWLMFQHHSRGFEVKGSPWITDIPRSLSPEVSVSPQLPDEDCYELLRPYGRIVSVQNGVVRFFSTQDAVTASFCAHRSLVQNPENERGVQVRLSLVERTPLIARTREWAGSHPRVVIPVLFAILFAVAYSVFEPIRELSIGLKVRGTFESFEGYVKWARENSQKLIGVDKLIGNSADPVTKDTVSDWNSTAKSADALRSFIDEGAPTFIVVSGPKGSGKEAIVDAALSSAQPNSRASHPYILSIDCSKLNAANDVEELANIASSLGYWPMFLWTNRLLRAAELGIQGLTGQSAGLTETKEQQVNRMLNTASHALRRVALENKPAQHTNENSYLENHPNELPVVLLRGFPGNSSEMSDLLTAWVGDLTKQQIARVVFVTQEAAFDKRLSAALPNKVFRVVQVEDAAPKAAKEYILRRFVSQAETDSARRACAAFEQLPVDFLEPLGGRYADLQSFGRRLLSGESPERALSSLVHSAALEASQLFLTEGHKWTVEQAWTLVRGLANASGDAFLSVPGNVAAQAAFDGSEVEASLEALEQSGLVTLRSTGGRITGVKPSRPLYRAAFLQLSEDPLVAGVMAKRLAKFNIARETGKIKAAEEELVTLAAAMQANSIREVKERQDYLAKQLGVSQAKVQKYQNDYLQTVADLSEFEWFNSESPRRSGGGIFSKKEVSSQFE